MFPGVFYFEANQARAADVASAISDFYHVSVLVFGSEQEHEISGRLLCTNVVDAVESLAFLLGSKYRKLNETVYLIGGKPEKIIREFNSYGLQPQQLAGSLREGVSVLGDRVIVETDQVRANQIGEVLAGLAARRSLTVEVFFLDVSDTQIERVNAWLNSFRIGAGYFQNSAVPYLGLAGATQGAIQQLGASSDASRVRGVTGLVDAQALLDFVNLSNGVRIAGRERVQVISGGRALFQSGQVLEDTTYTTVPNNTSQTLVSQITRRTVGLVMRLEATWMGTNWFLGFSVDDSSLSGTSEFTTHYEGERIVRPGAPFFLLASFTRHTTEQSKDGLPILSDIPVLKRVFTKETISKTHRNVMVLARPVSDDLEAGGAVPPKEDWQNVYREGERGLGPAVPVPARPLFEKLF